MANLKKGAKGNPVKDLQSLLNKAGARPKLDVDGDFGPLTDAAVRAFQKKAKLKSTGIVDALTLAAIKYGGPLPEMTVPDFEARRAEFQKAWNYNQKNVATSVAIQKEVKSLNDILTKKAEQADSLFMLRQDSWNRVAELSASLVEKQKEFDKILLTNPGKAATLASDCASLEKTIDKIGPNTAKTGSVLKELSDSLASSMAIIKKELGAAATRKSAY